MHVHVEKKNPNTDYRCNSFINRPNLCEPKVHTMQRSSTRSIVDTEEKIKLTWGKQPLKKNHFPCKSGTQGGEAVGRQRGGESGGMSNGRGPCVSRAQFIYLLYLYLLKLLVPTLF